jgi:hypothetical protein
MGMRSRATLAATVLLICSFARAASPEANGDTGIPTFSITSAEVHVSISAVDQRNQPVSELSANDLVMLREGHPVERVVSFGKQHQTALSAFVLKDVSDSMRPGISLNRDAIKQLQAAVNAAQDHLALFDFGFDVRTSGDPNRDNDHLTSLYDSAVEIIPRIAYESSSTGRRALILPSDGGDNSSLHSLREVITLAQKYDVTIDAVTAHPNRKQFLEADLCATTHVGNRWQVLPGPQATRDASGDL